MISAENISVALGGHQILSNLSLKICPGEIVAMVGANGAGKSTSLRVLSGEIKPDTGLVKLNEKPLNSWDPKERARRMAVLPQSSTLSFGLSVEDIVALGRLPTDGITTKEQDETIIEEAMRRTDILHLARRNYLSLSGGEKLRTHLSRTIAQVIDHDGKYDKALLLDEPTSSLDLNHQLRVLELVRELANEGMCIFTILHDLNLAARFADRLYVLKSGECIRQGRVNEVLDEAVLLEGFGLVTKLVEVDGLSHPTVCVIERIKN